MSVNGVEIKVGQKWLTRGGTCVEIASVDSFSAESSIASHYPFHLSNGRHVTRSGLQYEGVTDKFDLVELVEASTRLSDLPMGMIEPGYEALADVMQRAYNQAALGKGKERHSQVGEPFDKQVMQDGAKRFGVGALLFQAYKKSEESQRLPLDRAVNELLGAMVYLAGAVIRLEAVKALDKGGA